MRYAVLIARFLLGAPFIFFGLNFFVRFVEPPEMPEAAGAFLDALTATGFMHELRSVVEVASGAMILTGLFLPLGLTILAPVVVHIILYHHFLDPNGLVLAYVILALGLFLAFAHSSSFRGILNPTARHRWSERGE